MTSPRDTIPTAKADVPTIPASQILVKHLARQFARAQVANLLANAALAFTMKMVNVLKMKCVQPKPVADTVLAKLFQEKPSVSARKDTRTKPVTNVTVAQVTILTEKVAVPTILVSPTLAKRPIKQLAKRLAQKRNAIAIRAITPMARVVVPMTPAHLIPAKLKTKPAA